MSETRADPRHDPVLRRFRDAVAALYGERLERMVLFGSRARGDARGESDYDVAVFLRRLGSWSEESRKLAQITTEILVETGAEINPLTLPAGSYRKRTPLMHEVRNDGRDLTAHAGRNLRDLGTSRLTRVCDEERSGQRAKRMSPEAAYYLRGARLALTGAEAVLERAKIPSIAAREAYLAALSAARAVIWERTGKVAKTHAGSRTEIGRLAREDQRIDAGFARFLAEGVKLKITADYEIGQRDEISTETAERFIAEARRLLAHTESLLAAPDAPPPAA